MWKPRSDTDKSEWKWIHAAGPVVLKGAGDAVLQYFPRTGSSERRPSRIYEMLPHNTVSAATAAVVVLHRHEHLSDLQEVEVAVGVMLQTESPKSKGDEQARLHRHRPVAIPAWWVVSRVTR